MVVFAVVIEDKFIALFVGTQFANAQVALATVGVFTQRDEVVCRFVEGTLLAEENQDFVAGIFLNVQVEPWRELVKPALIAFNQKLNPDSMHRNWRHNHLLAAQAKTQVVHKLIVYLRVYLRYIEN